MTEEKKKKSRRSKKKKTVVEETLTVQLATSCIIEDLVVKTVESAQIVKTTQVEAENILVASKTLDEVGGEVLETSQQNANVARKFAKVIETFKLFIELQTIIIH